MKFLLPTITPFLLLLQGLSALGDSSISRRLQSPESKCLVQSKVYCKVTSTGELEGMDCERLAIMNPNHCGEFDVSFDYTMCNDMRENSVNLVGATEAKFRSDIVTGIDKGDIAPNSCRTATISKTVDTCNGAFSASMKLQGWVKGFERLDNYYCYAWAFNQIKIRMPGPSTLDPTKYPSEIPTTVASSFPSSMPSMMIPIPTDDSETSAPTPATSTLASPPIMKVKEAPRLTLSIQCFGELPYSIGSGNYVVKCVDLRPVDSCQRHLKYRYIITNESSGSIRVQGLVTSETGYDLSIEKSIEELPPLGPGETEIVEIIKDYDFCKHEVIVVRGVVFGGSLPHLLPAYVSEFYTFNVPFFDASMQVVDTRCFLKVNPGVSCSDYADTISSTSDCIIEVVFQYTVTNTGLGCVDIDQASAMFIGYESDPSQAYQSTASPCDRSKLCHRDEIDLYQEKTSLNICEYGDDKITIEVMINGGGAGKEDFGTYSFEHTHTGSTSYRNDDITDDDDDVGIDTICRETPNMLIFKWRESSCEFSRNDQKPSQRRHLRALKHKSRSRDTGDTKGEGYICEDYCDFDDKTRVVIDSGDGKVSYYDGFVQEDEIITIAGSISSNLHVTAYDEESRKVQEFTFHASCSQPLALDDSFGSLKIVGFKNVEQGLVTHD